MNEKISKISDTFIKIQISSSDSIESDPLNALKRVSVPINRTIFQGLSSRVLVVVEEFFLRGVPQVLGGGGAGIVSSHYLVSDDFDGFHIFCNLNQTDSYSTTTKAPSQELIFIPNMGDRHCYYREVSKLSGIITRLPSSGFDVLSLELRDQDRNFIDASKVERWHIVLRIHPIISMQDEKM